MTSRLIHSTGVRLFAGLGAAISASSVTALIAGMVYALTFAIGIGGSASIDESAPQAIVYLGALFAFFAIMVSVLTALVAAAPLYVLLRDGYLARARSNMLAGFIVSLLICAVWLTPLRPFDLPLPGDDGYFQGITILIAGQAAALSFWRATRQNPTAPSEAD